MATFSLTKEQIDIQKAAELGFLAVFIPEQYGGLGLGYLEQCLIAEEFARADLGIAHAIESTFFGTQLIQLVGTEEQKRKSWRSSKEARKSRRSSSASRFLADRSRKGFK